MTEFLQSVYDDFKSRIESPFLFATFLSWCFWNKDFVWFVLIGESVGKYYKIVDWEFNWLYAYFLPLLTAPIFVLLIPAVNNLLMLYRYRLLSSFQHKVQESKGKYTAALEIMYLKKVAAEIERKEEDLKAKESAYLNAKLALDKAEDELNQREIQHQESVEIENKRYKEVLITNRESKNWPVIKLAYESKINRIQMKKSGNLPLFDQNELKIGGFVQLLVHRLNDVLRNNPITLEGYFDEMIINESVPAEFYEALIGKSIGAAASLNIDYHSDEMDGACRIEIISLSPHLDISIKK